MKTNSIFTMSQTNKNLLLHRLTDFYIRAIIIAESRLPIFTLKCY